ncbi:amino acid ABC transporter substrate-binding protein (PAAT family) [Pseudodesulfovibrio indicus]|uniref:Amino acid ABC transporter substrate-binding protein (PAAT family) n=2 Tax=Pseudodesulfovibrio indicus TaxID=1716143 RepID=A0AA94PNN8_9BACT|nr:amino acid ABC transporter substrate-binding protein (PAAT family) [Pseudodesulfovibrio indicus]
MGIFFFNCLFFLCSLLMAAPCLAHETGRMEDLVYLTEDLPPLSFAVNGEATGLAVDVLRLMWQRMGEKAQPIRIVPWVRAYYTLREEKHAVIFSTYRTAERETQFRWVGPIIEGELAVYALRARALRAESLKDLATYRIAGLRDAAATIKLERAGIPVMIASKLENALKMMDSGRIEALTTDRFRLRATLRDMGRPFSDITELWVLSRDSLFYAFNKETSPELIRRFQEALDGVRRSPEYKNLLNYYGI